MTYRKHTQRRPRHTQSFGKVVAAKTATIALCWLASLGGVEQVVSIGLSHFTWMAMEVVNERSLRQLDRELHDEDDLDF